MIDKVPMEGRDTKGDLYEYVKEQSPQTSGRNLVAFGRQEPVEYRQEDVEVLSRSNMMQQVMRPPGVGHPSSIVYSQVDLYPHNN